MKEQEIAGLLRDGATPTHLVHQGYARGTVYKVHKRLRGEGGSPMGGGEVEAQVGDSLDNDPEILELKKALRKAQLQRELSAIKSDPGSEDRLGSIESRLQNLEVEVNGSLLAGVPEEFECWDCGSHRTVAVTVHCTVCESTVELGTYPGDVN